jgi:precorrin-6Y C5,15-methyltransferase (decarboxylating)
MNKVWIIGLGLSPADLSAEARRRLEAADVLAGGKRLLDHFPDHPGRRLILDRNLSAWLDDVAREAESGAVTVVASGDPNFHGAAARLIDRLGEENAVVIPNLTAFQHAFARLNLSWSHAALVSCHGRGQADLWTAVARRDLIAVYTDPESAPDRLAAMMLQRGQDGWRMHAAEDLGGSEERIRSLTLEEAAEASFHPLNLVILQRTRPVTPLCLGLPESAYDHDAGLITKAEVRMAVLGALGLLPGQTVWDLGAGSGAVGIEASLLVPGGRVTAVERRPERVERIKANRAKFGAAQVEVVEADLSYCLPDLPDPDRVFVGGGGDAAPAILAEAAPRLSPGGVLVAALVRIHGLAAALHAVGQAGLSTSVTQVWAARGAELTGDVFLKAQNPVWLLIGRRMEDES